MRTISMFLTLLICCPCLVANAQQPTARMSITEFVQDPDRVAALKQGVAVMKGRKPSDPTSWFFQGAVHGVTDEAIAEAAVQDPDVEDVAQAKFWNQCPHNGAPSADFLLWHRAYIFYFERILRQASGDPTLSLPYWNYTGDERAFPALLGNAEPDAQGNPTNPLYEDRRELLFVFGLYELSDSVVTTDMIFDEENFFGASESEGFAGGVADPDPSTRGLIERQPHDLMHVAIGGIIGPDVGLMSSVPTAAFDPAFWVHHTNIDRLWSRWETMDDRKWGTIPPLDWFHSSPWFFNDADGTVKNNPRYHYLKYRDLGVTYGDDDPSKPRLSDNLPTGVGQPTLLLAAQGIVSQRKTTTKLSAREPVEVTVETGEARVTAQAIREMVGAAPAATKQLVMELTYSIPNTIPNVSYNVFVTNNGDNEDLTPGTIQHVGMLNLFGIHHEHGNHSDNETHSTLLTQTFNVTRIVTADQNLDLSTLSVVVKPFDLFKSTRPDIAMVRRSGEIMVHHVKFRIK